MSSATKAKLYYTPTSCGFASFLSAHAGKTDIDSEQVDLKTHLTAGGADFYKINPKGNVPSLVLPNGVVLNEGAAILQWIADNATGERKVAPANGTVGRYQVQNALNYIASEVHTNVGGLFNPKWDDAARALIKERAYQKFEYLTKNDLNGKNYLVGDSFTIADAYLYIVLSWSGYVGLTLDNHPVIKAYFERIGGLDFVKEAHALANAAAKK